MAVKLTITVLLLACVRGIYSLSPTEKSSDPVLDPPALPLACSGANEEFSVCGNLCEDTCNNRCEEPVSTSLAVLASSNPNCVAGCYCSTGFIRNLNGNCVTNTPNVCGSDLNRCGVVSPNAVYQKCALSPETCYYHVPPHFYQKPYIYRGRCVCETGYSMNLNRKCIRTNSRTCRSQNNITSNIHYMQTTSDC